MEVRGSSPLSLTIALLPGIGHSAIASPAYTLELHRTASLEAGAATPEATLTLEPTASAVLGRDSECDLVVPSKKVSRRHCEVESLPNGGVIVRDLESANGVWLARIRVEDVAQLSPGVSFEIGEYSVHLRALEASLGRAGDDSSGAERKLVAIELLLALVLVIAGGLAGLKIGARVAAELDAQSALESPGNRLGENSSFEANASGLPGWSVSSRGGVFRADRIRGGVAGGGRLCLEVAPASQTLPGDRCVIVSSALVSVLPGDVLLADAAIFVEDGAAGGGLAVELMESRTASLGTIYSVPVTQAGAWRTARLSLVVPERVRQARLCLISFGGGSGVTPVRFDQVLLRKRRAEESQHPTWTSAQLAPLQVSPRLDGTFSLVAPSEGLVDLAALVIGENPLFHPTASQLFADRPAAAQNSSDGIIVDLEYRSTPEDAGSRVTHVLRQATPTSFTAEASLPAATGDAFWILELAPGVEVMAGQQRIEPGESGRGALTTLTLSSPRRRLKLLTSRPVAIRLDATGRGATLTLAFPRDGERPRRAALEFVLE